MVLHFLRPACASPVFQRPHGQASGRSWAVSGAAAITCVVGDASLTIGPAGGRALTPAAAHGTGRPAQSGSGERRSGMSQSQKSKGKKSSTSPAAVSDAKGTQQLQPTDRRPLVTSRTSPLIRVRFRNPIRLSLSGGCSSSDARGTTASQEAGGGGCDRRRRSADSASMTSETGMASGAGPGPGTAPVGDDPGAAPQRPRPRHGAGPGPGTAPVTTDDLSLVPRIRQYQKHELLQDRSPDSGLSEVEAFLLEKQRLMEIASTDNDNNDDDKGQEDKLVPRAPHYVPHPILQVKTETGLTELELYLKQKEEEVEQQAACEQQPAADAAPS